jgi:hypothetical protein
VLVGHCFASGLSLALRVRSRKGTARLTRSRSLAERFTAHEIGTLVRG